ncbi:hypothetical protein [Bifidobacterium sp. ESL0745]|uniref:hypothetical protein n=1 Tax=Bifidobacterium sp. ESL0745 TaxID=2983226 RepID=UPI0023F71E81|nr:hypothetical protein [Bifidobacterium sp. ESL0745]MDF7665689.1 hypothetical protein [Bifidobacterium sp. ESL0745]
MGNMNQRKTKGWLALASGVVGLGLTFGSVPWAGGLFGLAAGVLALDLALTKKQ